jgi:hypothetical protein
MKLTTRVISVLRYFVPSCCNNANIKKIYFTPGIARIILFQHQRKTESVVESYVMSHLLQCRRQRRMKHRHRFQPSRQARIVAFFREKVDEDAIIF